MKRLCPRCEGRLRSLYTRVTTVDGRRSRREFVTLDDFGWCEVESVLVHVPSKSAFRVKS